MTTTVNHNVVKEFPQKGRVLRMYCNKLLMIIIAVKNTKS